MGITIYYADYLKKGIKQRVSKNFEKELLFVIRIHREVCLLDKETEPPPTNHDY